MTTNPRTNYDLPVWRKIGDESQRVMSALLATWDAEGAREISSGLGEYLREYTVIDVCAQRAKLLAKIDDVNAIALELSIAGDALIKINNLYFKGKETQPYHFQLLEFAHDRYQRAIVESEQVLARREAA